MFFSRVLINYCFYQFMYPEIAKTVDEETGNMIEAADCLKKLVVDAGKVKEEDRWDILGNHITIGGNNPANAIIAKFGSIWTTKSKIGSSAKREDDSGQNSLVV